MSNRKIFNSYQNILNTYGATKVISAEVGPSIKIINDKWDPDPNWISLEDMINMCVKNGFIPGVHIFAIQKVFWKGKDKAFFYGYLSDNKSENVTTGQGNDVYIFSKIVSPLIDLINAWDTSPIPSTLTKVHKRISEQEIHLQHSDNTIHFTTNNIISNRNDISNNIQDIKELYGINTGFNKDISNNFKSINNINQNKTDKTDFDKLEKRVSSIENNIKIIYDNNEYLSNKINELTDTVTKLCNILIKKL